MHFIIQSVAAAGRTFEIIDRVPEIPSSLRNERGNLVEHDHIDSSNVITKTADGHNEAISISFQNIEFAYPARPDIPVLGPNFSLDITAGENISLVGGSGSGKSTVAALLARLYNLDSGSILINGHNIECIDPAFLRRHIGVVSQVSTH
jgi:ABC-type multidrug transport system fused ATPase/permease subunit